MEYPATDADREKINLIIDRVGFDEVLDIIQLAAHRHNKRHIEKAISRARMFITLFETHPMDVVIRVFD